MQLIDTHAHIYLPEFDSDREELLKRAAEKGITHILMPAIDTATHQSMLAVAAQWPQCQAMMGVHPCSIKENYKDELNVVETYLQDQKFTAVGEIGLDFYWDVTFKQQQYEAFEMQIEWAIQYNLPIVIHSRNALAECIDVVSNFPNAQGVFHCFSGTAEQAQRIMELGFYLGIGGVVTYKKAGLDNVLKAVGLEAVVLETDAPYLTPVPHRGKRNEPSYIPLIAAKVAEALNLPIELIATISTQNASKLFKLS